MRSWDDEYRNGMWNNLGRIDEVGHHGIVAGLVRYLDKGDRVLDIGCGTGLLEKYLNRREYHGLDISSIAIQAVRPDVPCRLFTADMEKWEPPNDFKYSAIIFNESFYYLNNPKEMLDKVRTWLQPDGVVIISMWKKCFIELPGWKKLVEFRINTDADDWMVGAYV